MAMTTLGPGQAEVGGAAACTSHSKIMDLQSSNSGHEDTAANAKADQPKLTPWTHRDQDLFLKYATTYGRDWDRISRKMGKHKKQVRQCYYRLLKRIKVHLNCPDLTLSREDELKWLMNYRTLRSRLTKACKKPVDEDSAPIADEKLHKAFGKLLSQIINHGSTTFVRNRAKQTLRLQTTVPSTALSKTEKTEESSTSVSLKTATSSDASPFWQGLTHDDLALDHILDSHTAAQNQPHGSPASGSDDNDLDFDLDLDGWDLDLDPPSDLSPSQAGPDLLSPSQAQSSSVGGPKRVHTPEPEGNRDSSKRPKSVTDALVLQTPPILKAPTRRSTMSTTSPTTSSSGLLTQPSPDAKATREAKAVTSTHMSTSSAARSASIAAPAPATLASAAVSHPAPAPARSLGPMFLESQGTDPMPSTPSPMDTDLSLGHRALATSPRADISCVFIPHDDATEQRVRSIGQKAQLRVVLKLHKSVEKVQNLLRQYLTRKGPLDGIESLALFAGDSASQSPCLDEHMSIAALLEQLGQPATIELFYGWPMTSEEPLPPLDMLLAPTLPTSSASHYAHMGTAAGQEPLVTCSADLFASRSWAPTDELHDGLSLGSAPLTLNQACELNQQLLHPLMGEDTQQALAALVQ
ncbi:uncharacterized protein MONBRDRAFT_8523 [Monosiga brevicollis MX1]|uniref:Myb-like domain-containing protein n=1 Tax=Monosiga brevicollis TaxID=81824 RepID=A9V0A4_MONBE|nr:uncharacterized protein MONBRDRAFT_8523 [Monosiga brevicollis MX1]EDQ89124.1 predicted protein [Monosiga brevicollis MX1]|eukprot:XP_001746229.1 hypothetical protein [Monosiga brevicollis MX1]